MGDSEPRGQPQIPPLRFARSGGDLKGIAAVGMTNLKDSLRRIGTCKASLDSAIRAAHPCYLTLARLRPQAKYSTVSSSSQGMPVSMVRRMPSTHQVEMMMASTAAPPRIVVTGNSGMRHRQVAAASRLQCLRKLRVGDEDHQPDEQRRRTARCRTCRRRPSSGTESPARLPSPVRTAEKIERRNRRAFSATRDPALAARSRRATSEKIMRVARYRLQFMPESAAVSTTKLTMLRAAGTCITSKTRTNGLTVMFCPG